MRCSAVFLFCAALVWAGDALAERAQEAGTVATPSAARLAAFNAEIEALPMRERSVARTLLGMLDRSFGPDLQALPSLDVPALEALYNAAYGVTFYTLDKRAATTLLAVSREVDARDGAAQPLGDHPYLASHHQATYSMLINARLFDLAERYREEQPTHVTAYPANLDNLAKDDTTGQPAVLVLDRDDDRLALNRRQVEVTRGEWLVAVVHPSCGFSRQAMERIEADARFTAALPRNVLWVASQLDTARPDPLIRWNDSSALIDVVLVDRQRDWPDFFDFSQTPQFYLLREGVVLDRLIGWSGASADDELVAALQRAFGER